MDEMRIFNNPRQRTIELSYDIQSKCFGTKNLDLYRYLPEPTVSHYQPPRRTEFKPYYRRMRDYEFDKRDVILSIRELICEDKYNNDMLEGLLNNITLNNVVIVDGENFIHMEMEEKDYFMSEFNKKFNPVTTQIIFVTKSGTGIRNFTRPTDRRAPRYKCIQIKTNDNIPKGINPDSVEAHKYKASDDCLILILYAILKNPRKNVTVVTNDLQIKQDFPTEIILPEYSNILTTVTCNEGESRNLTLNYHCFVNTYSRQIKELLRFGGLNMETMLKFGAYQKYLKYKTKYLKLKELLETGYP